MQIMRRQESWDPFRELETLSNRFNRLLGFPKWSQEIGERERLATMDWAPSCDISETDKEYHVYAELPKVNKDNVHVTLENGVLTIQGQRQEEKEDKGVKFHRRELSYGTFTRSFTMPDDADQQKIDASFKDGILDITINKTTKKPTTTKEIAIH